MKFILTSTSGKKYDIPTTTETIKRKVELSAGITLEQERIEDICEANSIEELIDMVDRLNSGNEYPDESDYIQLILGRYLFNAEYLSLEIYDAYRE